MTVLKGWVPQSHIAQENTLRREVGPATSSAVGPAAVSGVGGHNGSRHPADGSDGTGPWERATR